MSEKSPISNEHILVPRTPKPGEDPSTRKIEVWKRIGENPDGTVRADAQTIKEIQVVEAQKKRHFWESKENKTEKVVDSKDIDAYTASPAGQFELARELGGLLLGDEGAPASPEVLDQDEVREVGEVALEADKIEEAIDADRTENPAALQDVVGRVEATPSPWSKEAADAKKAAENPTREHPRMFDLDQGLVRHVTYDADGTSHSGVMTGIFYENGKNYIFVQPDGSDGEMIAVDMDKMTGQTSKPKLPPEVPIDKIPTPTELAEMMSGEPRSIAEILARSPENKRARDKIELESYAATDAGLINNPDDPSLNMIKHQNWTRMSPEARKWAVKYSELVNGRKAA